MWQSSPARRSVGSLVTSTASANVQVLTTGLTITKTPDSQTVRKGDSATFTITVTNTGEAQLTGVTVTDALTADCAKTRTESLGVSPNNVWSYTCTQTNVQAAFTNTAIADSTETAPASDGANVTVIDPGLSMVKKINDLVVTGPGDRPQLHQGTLASWIYQIKNTGDVALTDVTVYDDPNSDDPNGSSICPKAAPITLAVGESMTCFGYHIAILGPYANTGTVTGTPPAGGTVSASDTSSYTGINPAVVGNRVWLDENGNGIQDAGEPGLANQTVQLKDSSGSTVLQTTSTDADGGYLFHLTDAGATAASYQVVVTPATGLNPTFDEDNGITIGHQTTVSVAAGGLHLRADFGYNWVLPTDSTNPAAATTGAIGDRVWNDADGDGRQDPAEAGIAGVTVTLTGAGADGLFGTGDDPTAQTRTTDAAGNYVFDDLPKGVYSVAISPVTLPGGVTWTQTGDPDLGGPIDHQSTTPIVLAPGDVYVNADFGYQPTLGSHIGDTIWLDVDGNKALDTYESGIAGVSVALLRDSDGQIIATALTDTDGQYLFTGLPAGIYRVLVTDTLNTLGQLEQSYGPLGILDGQSTITVNGSADVLNQDFGYTPFGEHKNFDEDDGVIGDTVFLDRNGNGQYDPGEGLEGVTLRLYDSLRDSVVMATTVTNANGTYGFGRLDINPSYLVKVDTSTLPNSGLNLTNTVIRTSTSGDSQSIVPALIGSGGINLVQDFGYATTSDPAAIGGTLWKDTDADGVLDTDDDDEAGMVLANVSVALRDSLGNQVATTVSDSNGNYLFSGLPAGPYTVAVTDTANLLEGWWHSLGDQTATVDNTSKADPFTVTVAGGETNTKVDFGYYNQGAALGNRVWSDANADGIQDPGEGTGPSGVAVQLVITYPNSGGTTTLVSSTGSNGGYRFGNLLLDESYNGEGTGQPTYVISIPTVPAGTVASSQGHGTPLTDSNNPAGTAATLVKGQTDTAVLADPAGEGTNAGYDFGYFSTGGLSGHLYIDTDGNGQQDSGEPNLAGVDVVINDVSGGTHRVTSDGFGNYSATGIPAGSAGVDVDQTDAQFPTGYTQTEGNDPTLVTVPNIGSVSAGNDGYAPINLTGTVSGHLFIDANGNGTQDTGELNLANIDVLITDVNGGTQTRGSGTDGTWTATVPPGATTANVQEDDPQFPGGYTQTAGTDPTTVTAVTGQNIATDSDGYAPPASQLGTVTGHVYIDSNGDHSQGPGEPNVANLNVIITDRNGGTQTVATDANGIWSARVVAGPGSASLDTSDPQYPSGYVQTQGENPTVFTALGDQTATGGTDGFAPASTGMVTGHLYIDTNGNGTQGTGEPNLANVDVLVTDANGGTQTVATDSSGNWTATVPPGLITADVQQTDPDFPPGSRQTQGEDPTSITAVGDQTVSAGIDGYAPETPAPLISTVIGNRVWLDENGDGVQDAGESGIANLVVQLLNGTGTLLLDETLTGADGGYLFSVDPGTYVVRVLAPDGLNATFDQDATLNSETSVTVQEGDEHLSADFGYNWVVPSVSSSPAQGALGAIGDRIWNDASGDGRQAPGESGISGVTVQLLTDDNGDGAYGSTGDTAAQTAVTDAMGQYRFTGLSPRAYVVQVMTDTLPTGFKTAPTGDPDGDGNSVSQPIMLAPGDVYLNADFGYQRDPSGAAPGYTIGDTLYFDANGNGQQGSGETGIGGVTVTLLNADGQVIATDVTDATGGYYFLGLPAGVYTVVVTDTDNVLGETLISGDPDGGSDGQSVVTLVSSDNLNQDFGYTANGAQSDKGLIGDTVFLDRNANGSPDQGEGMEGVAVALYDSTGARLLANTTTNENGSYAFGGLEPSASYLVRADTTTLPGASNALVNTIDPDGGFNSQAVRNLQTTGLVDLSADFGYVPSSPASLSGLIWKDQNADGARAAGESVRFLGVTVELRDANGIVVGTTLTNAAGVYSFTRLPSGSYLVDVTDQDSVLKGYWHSQGTNSQLDPAAVTLTGGQSATADFGYYNDGAALGNRVWRDTNGDGIQQATETAGIPGGVTLKLVITYPTTGGTTTATAYTQSSATDGGYSFGNLLLDESFTGVGAGQPTNVISVVTTPSGYQPSPVNLGGNARTDSNQQAGTTATVERGQTAVAVLASNANGEAANASYDFGYLPAALSCTVICDVNIDGKVNKTDLNWINANARKTVNPAGAANSGDCVKDGKLTINDVTACQAYQTP